MEEVKIATFNVHGIRDSRKRLELYKFLRYKQYDLILLQETHSTSSDEHLWQSQWSGPMLFSHGTNNSKGVVILTAKKSAIQVIEYNSPNKGRILDTVLDIKGTKDQVINIYAPNTDEPSFYEQIGDLLENSEQESKLIGGDLNLCLDMHLDKRGGITEDSHPNAVRTLKAVMKCNNLVDIWRIQNPHENKYTWKRLQPQHVFVRLDYLLVSEMLTEFIPKTGIEIGYKSDHDIPFLIFKKQKSKRGPGFWKLNVALLDENEYCEEITNIIREEKSQRFDSPGSKWDYIQYKVRQASIRYSSQKKKSRINQLKALEWKIELSLHDLIHGNELFSEQQIIKYIELLKRDREQIIQYMQKGAAIRARRDWLQYGEKNSKLFFRLEKRNFTNKTMYQLRNKQGRIITDNHEILKEQHSFFEKLFSTRNTELPTDYLKNLQIPQISQEDKQWLSQEITMQEVKMALFSMKFDKVTGSQGLPPEWYVKFWDEINGILFQTIKDAAKQGFSKTSSRGIISLMEKPNKDRLRIEQWCPLSLLNTDFKILSKILANRMGKILLKIIHSDQHGFLPK